MQSFPLKLAPGSDLRLSIENSAKLEGHTGFVLGVVGNLSRACFQCPGRPNPTVMEGNLEIITLNGTFSPESVHLHLSLSDGECQVWGGHLELGTYVLKGADLLLGLLDYNEPKADSTGNTENNVIPRLEVAVMPGCPWSSRTLRRLTALDIPHKVKIVDNDDDFLLSRKRSGVTTFPQIFVDGKFIGGFESLRDLDASGKLEELR